jgi:hypothetical protein
MMKRLPEDKFSCSLGTADKLDMIPCPFCRDRNHKIYLKVKELTVDEKAAESPHVYCFLLCCDNCMMRGPATMVIPTDDFHIDLVRGTAEVIAAWDERLGR